MLNVKVLGPGCANCKRLEQSVRRVADSMALPIELEHVTDYAEIAKWNILQTPGLVMNDKVVSAGRIPKDEEIARMLQTQPA
jgi:small redox-active disulfide protein 2